MKPTTNLPVYSPSWQVKLTKKNKSSDQLQLIHALVSDILFSFFFTFEQAEIHVLN